MARVRYVVTGGTGFMAAVSCLPSSPGPGLAAETIAELGAVDHVVRSMRSPSRWHRNAFRPHHVHHIHMPLVATPMIAPSRRLNPIRPITTDHVAAMVVRGLVDKPGRIDTPIGTLADVGMYFAPKLSRSTSAIRIRRPPGVSQPGVAAPSEQEPTRRPKGPVHLVAATLRVPRALKRAVRLVPGVHW